MRLSATIATAAAIATCALVLPEPSLAASNPVPSLGSELPAGHLRVRDAEPTPADGSRPRAADGATSDWIGVPTRYSGTARYSHGEFVYTDHLWDAYGASGPQDAARHDLFDALAQQNPDFYRAQGAPLFFVSRAYGAGPVDYAADLTEVRVAAAGDAIELLARTTVMTDRDQPAILALVDTTPGEHAPLSVPFNSGISTTKADVALLLTAQKGVAVKLSTGARSAFPTAASPGDYDNAIEASVPRSLLGSPASKLDLAVAAGRLDPASGELAQRQTGPAIANVAFRTQEPVRPLFDRQQAGALEQGTIDPFFATVDLARLRAGTNEDVSPGPGYYERVMTTDPAMSKEIDDNGVLQNYGLYVPDGVDLRRPVASTLYLHGSADGTSLEPSVITGLMRAVGDERHAVVIAPHGRTAISMWEGAGLEDLFAAWRDGAGVVRLDRRRTTLAGYSMGGYGAFLVAALFPDRFAATWSIEGLTGGRDPSPVTAIHGVPDARKVFANLRWVPTLIQQGGADFNVDIKNGLDAEDTLHALGYRSRLLLYPADNHYTPGVIDRWDPGLEYLAPFTRIDPNPPRVTYVRDMAFERAINKAEGSDQKIFPSGGHQMRFDRAYWMRGLTAASDVATIDVRSLAIPATPYRVSETSGSGAVPDPYVSKGDDWVGAGPPSKRSNGFTAVAKGASAVTLDARRMRLDACRRIDGTVETDHPLTIQLAGRWPARVRTTVDGTRQRFAHNRRRLVLAVPAGKHAVRILGRCA